MQRSRGLVATVSFDAAVVRDRPRIPRRFEPRGTPLYIDGDRACVIVQVAHERAVRAAARREDKVKAFRGWSRLKAITEAAVRCLQDIDAPTEKNAGTSAQECWLEVRGNVTRGDRQERAAEIRRVRATRGLGIEREPGAA